MDNLPQRGNISKQFHEVEDTRLKEYRRKGFNIYEILEITK